MKNLIFNISECLNYDSSKFVNYPYLCIYKDELYCAWQEYNGIVNQIKIKKYNGNSWINVTDNLNYDGSKQAYNPNLCTYSNELYCAWYEYNSNNIMQIKIKKFSGSSWFNISDNLNYDSSKSASEPKFYIYSNELYCAWCEYNTNNTSQIKIKKYNGATWINISDCLNYDSSKNAYSPKLCAYKDELYCIWCENDSNNINQVKIKKYNGSNWINVSDCLNYDASKQVYKYYLCIYKDELYCVWQENNGKNEVAQIKVKKFNGSSWINVSECLNYDSSKTALNPCLCVYNNGLYCIWQEINVSGIYQIKMKRYNGSNWSNISDNLNYDSSKHASTPNLCTYKEELYCVWHENYSTNIYRIKMKKMISVTTNTTIIKDNFYFYTMDGNDRIIKYNEQEFKTTKENIINQGMDNLQLLNMFNKNVRIKEKSSVFENTIKGKKCSFKLKCKEVKSIKVEGDKYENI